MADIEPIISAYCIIEDDLTSHGMGVCQTIAYRPINQVTSDIKIIRRLTVPEVLSYLREAHDAGRIK